MQRFCRCIIWGIVCGLLGGSAVVPALRADGSSTQVATLKDQLEKGLRARRQVEFQFLAVVLQRVQQNRINLETVQGTYRFVTRKYGDRKYLVPVFEQVLRNRLDSDDNPALQNAPTTLSTD
jgi:hypothetical protein